MARCNAIQELGASAAALDSFNLDWRILRATAVRQPSGPRTTRNLLLDDRASPGQRRVAVAG